MDYNDKNKLLYNSKVIRNYVDLIKLKYHAIVNVEELLKYADIEPIQVGDDGVWFSQSQINRFYEKLVALTGNQDIAYDAGKHTVSPQAIGMLKQFFLAFGTPEKAFERIANAAKQLTRSADYSSEKVGQNKVKVIVKLKEGIKEEDFQCRNRMGYFVGVFKLFGFDNQPDIKHDTCMFKNGGDICEYFITWEESVSWINIIKDSIYNIFLKKIISKYFQDLTEKSEEHYKPYEDLYNEINTNYAYSLMNREISEILTNQDNIDGILSQIINVLRQRLKYERGLIMLTNEDKTKLIYKAGFGYTETQEKNLKKLYGFNIENKSKGAFIRSFLERKPIYVKDITKQIDELSDRSKKIAKELKVISFLCCPILFSGNSFGILAVEHLDPNGYIIERDRNLLMGIAHQIGLRIQLLKKEEQSIAVEKEDFARKAIHNIRQPVETIHITIEVIKRDFKADGLDNKLDRVERSIIRIEELVSGYLKKTKPLKERIKPVKLIEIINSVLPRFKTEYKDISLDFDNSIQNINADEDDFKCFLEEMLTNPKKNGADKIKLNVSVLNNGIQIVFEDNGRGIKKEHESIIFEPDKSSDSMGFGLGLYNVKKTIEEHNGTIFHDNTYKKGARFIISLPNILS